MDLGKIMTYGETINMDAEKKKAAKEDAKAKREALAKATKKHDNPFAEEDKEGEETEEKEGEK